MRNASAYVYIPLLHYVNSFHTNIHGYLFRYSFSVLPAPASRNGELHKPISTMVLKLLSRLEPKEELGCSGLKAPLKMLFLFHSTTGKGGWVFQNSQVDGFSGKHQR